MMWVPGEGWVSDNLVDAFLDPVLDPEEFEMPDVDLDRKRIMEDRLDRRTT